MKIRILAISVKAEHQLIKPLEGFKSVISYSDFDALIIDSKALLSDYASNDRNYEGEVELDDQAGHRRILLDRHAEEIRDLLVAKGGVVVVLIRPSSIVLKLTHWQNNSQRNEKYRSYFWTKYLPVDVRMLFDSIVGGSGSSVTLSAAGSAVCYLKSLKGNLNFQAYLDASMLSGGSIYATDSVGHPVAAELSVGPGKIVILPFPDPSIDPTRVGAVLVQTIRDRVSFVKEEAVPEWVKDYRVPGAEQFDSEIASMNASRAELDTKINELENKRNELLQYRELLFSTGKHVLEPAVRRAFALLGFQVANPDDYDGEWDLEMRDDEGMLFIGEIEGPEGAVDVDKFRQLHNYSTDQVLEGKENKAILVGNAFRQSEPNRRGEAFTDHAKTAASKFGTALVSTVPLFRAITSVLENPSDDLKSRVRKSIANCSGVWEWPQNGNEFNMPPQTALPTPPSA